MHLVNWFLLHFHVRIQHVVLEFQRQVALVLVNLLGHDVDMPVIDYRNHARHSTIVLLHPESHDFVSKLLLLIDSIPPFERNVFAFSSNEGGTDVPLAVSSIAAGRFKLESIALRVCVDSRNFIISALISSVLRGAKACDLASCILPGPSKVLISGICSLYIKSLSFFASVKCRCALLAYSSKKLGLPDRVLAALNNSTAFCNREIS
uniref:CSON012054 protein n=1 Tax=Culicoides sonorensis TaxID=179676 RepID=A0A336KN68_CULSO